jgi:hypothetical protein
MNKYIKLTLVNVFLPSISAILLICFGLVPLWLAVTSVFVVWLLIYVNAFYAGHYIWMKSRQEFKPIADHYVQLSERYQYERMSEIQEQVDKLFRDITFDKLEVALGDENPKKETIH